MQISICNLAQTAIDSIHFIDIPVGHDSYPDCARAPNCQTCYAQ